MKIHTAVISTRELQQALRDYCAVNGGIPNVVIVKSYEKEIQVNLAPGGMITTDEFRHAASGA